MLDEMGCTRLGEARLYNVIIMRLYAVNKYIRVTLDYKGLDKVGM